MSKDFKFPLAVSTWGQEEKQAMYDVIDSGMHTMGHKVKSFEEEFAKFVGSKYCVMVNSGSSANLLAIASLFYKKDAISYKKNDLGYLVKQVDFRRLHYGDEIIVPAVSWATSYHPLYQYGLKLKFVDIDLETLNYNLKDLKEAITADTKAILAVNLLGNPNNFEEVIQLSESKSLLLIEDNCESMGASFKNRQAGTFGIVGTYSTFFSHHIATGEGGLIVTNDEEIYHILLSLRAHGWTRQLPKINHVSNKLDDDFKEAYRFVLPGYNVRPLEISGAVGIEQIKKLPFFIAQRRKNANQFQSLMKDYSQFISIQKELGESSWFAFAMIVKPGAPFTREKFVKTLMESGIECRPIVAGNFANNTVVKEYYDYSIHNTILKNADFIDNNGIYIGNNHIDATEMLETLDKTLQELVK